MDQPSQHPATAIEPQVCCHCGNLTRDAVVVARAFSSSGVGTAIYACTKDAPRYRRDDGGQS
ncbi:MULTISPECIES: hypothetical protein [unclassified Streptomyces]|uniref:hypothetical protein n=1 Tax=unclassified Streptomyces TaxID=2593676 RepID=UPI00278C1A15|nr:MULTISPECIES: hypothetical protein [unclassified Streptomyces]